jgi:two-component system response regulator RegX3
MTALEPLVLVVEDEPSFAEALTIGLRRERLPSPSRATASTRRTLGASEPDLVLLDVMLPRLSGIDVCADRNKSAVPIIMVTAKTAEIDAVVGLEVGADDYVTKPYRLRELVARIRAVMRRTEHRREPAPVDEIPLLEVGDVTVDPERHEVTVRGTKVHVPLKEFELLTLLLENAGRVLTRDLIIDRAWGSDYHGDTKTLDVHIKRLRNKVEDDPRNPSRIVTIRGLGSSTRSPAPINERSGGASSHGVMKTATTLRRLNDGAAVAEGLMLRMPCGGRGRFSSAADGDDCSGPSV